MAKPAPLRRSRRQADRGPNEQTKEEEEGTMDPTTHQMILYFVAAAALVRSAGILLLKLRQNSSRSLLHQAE
jgi:hypothetical protein